MCPTENRSEPPATASSAPIANSTWVGLATPAVHADPVGHSMPGHPSRPRPAHESGSPRQPRCSPTSRWPARPAAGRRPTRPAASPGAPGRTHRPAAAQARRPDGEPATRRLQHGMVLGRRDQHPGTPQVGRAARPVNAFHRLVITLATTGEHHVRRPRAQPGDNRLAKLLHQAARARPAECTDEALPVRASAAPIAATASGGIGVVAA